MTYNDVQKRPKRLQTTLKIRFTSMNWGRSNCDVRKLSWSQMNGRGPKNKHIRDEETRHAENRLEDGVS